MIARYLGNKTSVLGPLLEVIGEHAEPGSHVVDAFSGSLSVAMALKKNGYRVTANDINLFSAVFADAYLIPESLPSARVDHLVSAGRYAELRPEAKAQADALICEPGFSFLNDSEQRERYTEYLTVLRHLETLTADDLPAEFRGTYIFDTYCEDGVNSAFTSSRGATGHRRFFIPENAARIDLILNQLRAWKQSAQIDPHTYALALSSLVRAVEKVSNTQGTFHDFLRDKWDSRALNKFTFAPIPLDGMLSGVGGHSAGREQDTLDFIGTVDEHSVLYLDPPYNFRQYSAYYFLPNLICRFPEMDDPDEYFSKVEFVRGQNPDDNFTSTFCKASMFIDDMRKVIERAKCTTVVVSYYNGANHWGMFDADPNDAGTNYLSRLLGEDLFVPGSQDVVEVKRRNYASYGGFKARNINELLLVADKRQGDGNATQRGTHRGVRAMA